MNKQEQFVSVDEQDLEVVSGGLLDIGNCSLNGNHIDILSHFCASVSTDDVLSNLITVLSPRETNKVVKGCGGCGDFKGDWKEPC